jgi:hypothetical protein
MEIDAREKKLEAERKKKALDSDYDGGASQVVSIMSSYNEIPDVYVYPCFLKGGKHQFLIGTETGDFHLHKFISPMRIDPIPSISKEIKTMLTVRTFSIKASVFQPYENEDK